MARPKAGSPSKKQQKGTKKAKKVKDPNAPKKPMTAFFYFVKSRREQGLDQGMKVAEFTKECGAKWKELTDPVKGDKNEKARFDKLALADRSRYEKEMKIFKPSGGAGANPNDPPKPKKASTAFILFANAKRPELMSEGFAPKEVLQEAGRLWKEMDDEDKREFNDAAEEEKKRYEKDMKKYEEERQSLRKNGAKKPAKKQESEDEEEDDDEDDDDMESDDE